MAEDEHNSRCSNNSSGSGGGGGGSSHRSSKKMKTKKVPQRGMGVAQLEKIISEQQQKKDAAFFTHNSIIPPTNSSPNFRPPNHHPLMSRTEGINPISASKPTNLIGGGGGGGSWSRLLSDGGYSFEGEKQNQTQNLGGLRYESNPSTWTPSPNLMLQRSQHLQQPCSSSMVNVSGGTLSSSSSSVLNFQMEPPSNQSYSGNYNYHPLWPQEEKMVGMKRPYPFLLESGPIPSFHNKFPSAYESASCGNGGITSIEPATHPSFRGNPSSSGVRSDAITKKFIDENQVLTRDFLKLAPPQASQSNSSSKEILYLSSCVGEQSQFETLPPQKDQSEDPRHVSGRGGSNPPPFFGFFPAARAPMGQPENNNGKAGESVDLNLKL